MLLISLFATYLLAELWSSMNDDHDVGIYQVILWFPFMYWGFKLILMERKGAVFYINEIEEKLEKIVKAPKV